MAAPRPGLFYLAKFLEAAGIGTFFIAIVAAVQSSDLSAYGKFLPIGAVLFLAGWLIERKIGTRPVP